LLNSQGGDSCTVLEQKQIEVEQLLGEKATLSDRLTAAIEALSIHEEKALQMEGQVDVLSSKAVELANENMRLEENSAGTSKFIQNLRSTLIQHKEKLTEETALRSNLESKVSELQASITATKELDEKYSVLQGEKAQLETQIQELEASSTGEYVKSLREKVSQQNIELATLRVELRKAEGNQHTAIKRVATELEGERGQVRRLKEEIRRLSSQRQPAKNLDSTYVAREPSRPPLADKPVTTCSNCQNQLRGQQDQTDKKPGLDEDAFMKHNGEGNIPTYTQFIQRSTS
jgi:DNA repair exonuclease SbcCD ATPase subunit